MSTNGHLLFVPSGGLANRMRAVASAYELCRRQSVSLRIVWLQDWALHAPFGALFEASPMLDVHDASCLDYLVYDRPRKRNLWIPKLFQHIIYDQRIDEPQVTPLKQRHFDFSRWVAGHKSYMSCYQEFGDFSNSLYAELFRPVAAVEERIRSFTDRFSAHTVGFHIRRTDNRESTEKSPLELFVEAGHRELAEYPDTMFFVATDHEQTKPVLRKTLAGRILTSPNAADRGSVEGIRGGLAEMYALSRASIIYGSAGSSFSVMASKIGSNPLVILSK